MKVPLVSLIFLKRFLVFPILLFSISLHWSLRKGFLSFRAILWNSAFKWVYLSCSLLFTSLLFIRKASSDRHFGFCISFSWGWSWSLSPVQCHEPLPIVHQALCLSDLIPWIYLSNFLFFNKQCKEIEENNRKGKIRDLFKKIRTIKEHFIQRWAQ